MGRSAAGAGARVVAGAEVMQSSFTEALGTDDVRGSIGGSTG